MNQENWETDIHLLMYTLWFHDLKSMIVYFGKFSLTIQYILTILTTIIRNNI